MGVSGAGKTTLARGIVEATGWDVLEGDDLHPAANVQKLASGTPLTDEDEDRALADALVELGLDGEAQAGRA